jgi:hypothetical protein
VATKLATTFCYYHTEFEFGHGLSIFS